MAFIHSPKIVTDGLVLYLDAANTKSYPRSGTIWNDLSGNNSSGSLFNNGSGLAFDGTNNGSIIFDGIDDYVSLGTFTNMGITDRTYSTWFTVGSVTSNFKRTLTFPADDTATDTPTYLIGYRSDAGLVAAIGGTPYNGTTTIANPSPTNTWLNVTTTVVSKTMTSYLNGVFVATATSTGIVSTSPIGYLGRYNATFTQQHNGKIASFMYYNRVLSPNEVLQNFNATRGRFGV